MGIEIERYYYFNHTQSVSGLSHYLLDLDANPQRISSTTQTQAYTQANEIEIYWDKTVGAELYELEWTYINDYGTTAGIYTAATAIPFSNQIMDDNATRVSTPHLSYRIPLIFDSGYLIYRVRPIGVLPENTNYQSPADLHLAVAGAWSTASVSGSNTYVSDFPNYQKLAAHQGSKNWQLATSFAEDGKKKEVISYFDGTLRNRQSVTRANTLNKAIVGENLLRSSGSPGRTGITRSCRGRNYLLSQFQPKLKRRSLFPGRF